VCLSILEQLTHLTLLELDGVLGIHQVEQMHLLLAQPLPLRMLRMSCYIGAWYALNLSNLTQLQELKYDGDGLSIAVLPPQLQRLHLGLTDGDDEVAPILQLQQLQCLSLKISKCKPELLLRLAAMPALQMLALRYVCCTTVISAAAASAAAAFAPAAGAGDQLCRRRGYRQPA
jgi:hypothetical protein